MYLELVQRSKELFTADLDIVENNSTVGSLNLKGKLGSLDANISIQYRGNEMTLTPGVHDFEIIAKKPFRPYTIAFNGTNKGVISQTEIKTGMFSKIEFHQIEIGGMIYEMYPIGFGNDGAKNPIYVGNDQRGLIEKDCEVINDLHNYKITCVDELSAITSLLFASYMYVNAAFKPGVAVTKSVHKVISKTTNKTLLQKYDPSFKGKYLK